VVAAGASRLFGRYGGSQSWRGQWLRLAPGRAEELREAGRDRR